MTTQIHPTAIVHPGAELDDEVRVGPFSVIGEHVRVGRGTVIEARASIEGWTRLGERCRIFQGACLGNPPQDLKYTPCRSYVEIGDDTQIREYVTIHPGTGPEESTRIGSRCLLMAYSHVAHNCTIEDEAILANSANLAGHITIEPRAIIGGVTGIHQFCRVGYGSIIGGCSAVRMDILPYVRAAGNPCLPSGLNVIGLKRAGFGPGEIRDLEQAYRIVFHEGLTVPDAQRRLFEEFPDSAGVRRVAEFLDGAERGLARPRGRE